MSEHIRVAYFTSVYPRASDSFIRNEISALRRRGVDVTTFALRQPDGAQLVSDELRQEANQTAYLIDQPIGRLCSQAIIQLALNPLRAARAVRVLFTSHAPGIINRGKQLCYLMEAACLARQLQAKGLRHVHNHIGENSATVAMLAALLSDTTYSLTIHGPGIFFHPRQWGLGEKIARSAFTACITHFCLSQCMIFTSPGAWQKLRIVRCGVGKEFSSAHSNPPPATPRFVCVGRLCPEKGHLVLLAAVKRLVLEGIAIELHLIGDGESRREIEDCVRKSGLTNHVHLHGWASADEIKSQLHAARALVLPSFAEGLPVVFMEALAMQRPVIGTQIAGIPELIEHGVHGWLIKPADVDSLCAAMRDAAERSTAEIQQMGDAGREAVQRQHDIDQEASKLQKLFTAVFTGHALPDQELLDSPNLKVAGLRRHRRPAELYSVNSASRR